MSWVATNVTAEQAPLDDCDVFEVFGPHGARVEGGPFTQAFAEEVAKALNERDARQVAA